VANATRQRLERAGVPAPFGAPHFNEFVVRAPDAVARWEALAQDGLVAGWPLGRWYPELADALLVCVTETHRAEAIDLLVERLTPAAAPARAARA
jgi:glycine dehydrogenase subunit 1